jgi:peptide deformylase
MPTVTKPTDIIQIGHPILWQTAQSVAEPAGTQTHQLIETLLSTVDRAQGVGIAAPQIAQPYRVFVVEPRPNERYPDAPAMEPVTMLNPRIVGTTSTIEPGWEGCLSVPGLRGWVPRAREIEVAYTDRAGREQAQTLTGFIARIFQHELDHLNGLLFLDRVESTHALYAETEYRKRIAG